MSFIYLGSPYTHPSVIIRKLRYEAALAAAMWLTVNHNTVYSPIVHYHQMALDYDLPKHSIFWEQHNFAMLEVARELVVLALPGHLESVGLTTEKTYALEHKISLRYLSPAEAGVEHFAAALEKLA